MSDKIYVNRIKLEEHQAVIDDLRINAARLDEKVRTLPFSYSMLRESIDTSEAIKKSLDKLHDIMENAIDEYDKTDRDIAEDIEDSNYNLIKLFD